MDEQCKKYHSALSRCAELLDNMKDGEPITEVPDFLAAKLKELNTNLASQSQAAQPSELTDEQAWKIATDLFGTFQYVSREGERVELQNAAEAGEFARAAIAAHLAGQSQATRAVPECYVLVPIKPTPEMIEAGDNVSDLYRMGRPELWGDVYHAMLAAAPTAPTAQEVTQQAAKAETAEQAKPVARLQIEVSDRPFSEGEEYYGIVILDRARCADGMELFAPTTSTVSAPEEVRDGVIVEVAEHFNPSSNLAIMERDVYRVILGMRTTSGKGEAA